ncbi:MAG TPA: hypothetical protein VFG83_10835 [Kofleriaceae bacterium]|nr:hypothetical protein [Kofleriaceae bacterium]
MRRWRAWLTTAVVIAGGCAGPRAAVHLSETWAAPAADYEDVTAAWTRRATIHSPVTAGYQIIADVAATFRSPAWRSAYVKHQSHVQLLTPEAQAALLSQEKKEHADAYVFEVMLATQHSSTNDLQKDEESVWRVELMNGRGETVLASDIDSDRRPREILEELYPHLGDFHEPYIVKFPRTIEVLYPGAKTMTLTISSPRGALRMVWKAGP